LPGGKSAINLLGSIETLSSEQYFRMIRDYRQIADDLAEDIRTGKLQAGDRLPPQREFAYRRGLAVSTASRVYAELNRRGLVAGEVGRGSYVRTAPEPAAPALSEPATAMVDLELNFPMPAQQEQRLAAALTPLLRPEALTQALRPSGPAAFPAAREIAAAFLARKSFRPTPETILFTGNGKQAIASALLAIANPGARVAVEPLTYPMLKSLAVRLGIELVPLALDDEGIIPDDLIEAHRTKPLCGVYLQPSLQNPLGLTMRPERRREIGQVLIQTGIVAIEDAIYGFLASDEAPLAAIAPSQTILIDSLSKRVAPGLALGFVVSPPHLVDTISQAIRTGGWTAMGFPIAAGLRWMRDGAATRVEDAKREDAKARQSIARRLLDGLQVRGDPRAYHLLLDLPAPWRAEAFAARASRVGIAVTPASAFAVIPGHAPNAVRLALASPAIEELSAALTTLRRIAQYAPAPAETE
jgi:DNA-binding transcriptional MocR family regulator